MKSIHEPHTTNVDTNDHARIQFRSQKVFFITRKYGCEGPNKVK